MDGSRHSGQAMHRCAQPVEEGALPGRRGVPGPAEASFRDGPSEGLGGHPPLLLLGRDHLLQAVAHFLGLDALQVGLAGVHPGGVPEAAQVMMEAFIRRSTMPFMEAS